MVILICVHMSFVVVSLTNLSVMIFAPVGLTPLIQMSVLYLSLIDEALIYVRKTSYQAAPCGAQRTQHSCSTEPAASSGRYVLWNVSERGYTHSGIKARIPG